MVASVIKKSLAYFRISLACLWMFLLVALPLQVVDGQPQDTVVLTVDRLDDSSVNSGCEDGLRDNDCALRGAISLANGNTTDTYIINIPDGIYILDGPAGEDLNASGDLDINHPNLTLQGFSQTGTILDGKYTDRVIDQQGSEDILVLNDLTIRNGDLDSGNGGGIRVSAGNFLNLDRVTVNNNASGAGNNGGGIYAMSGSILNIHAATIQNNDAASGAGIAASACQLNLYDSTVYHNIATVSGGGIASVAGGTTITIERSQIEANEAPRGGGIANTSASSLSVVDSTFENNQADISGGGLSTYGTVTLTNVTMHGNDALSTTFGDGGGGIYIYQVVVMVNVSVISNTAGSHGGGVLVANGGDLSLNHVTLANNQADFGQALYAPVGAVVQTRSTIFHELQGAATACLIDPGASWTNNHYNLSSDDSCNLSSGLDFPNTSPRFDNYGDHGGYTYTMSLLRDSTAIDHGAPSDPDERLDQRGIGIQDGNLNGTWRSDIGSYEFVPPVFLPFLFRP